MPREKKNATVVFVAVSFSLSYTFITVVVSYFMILLFAFLPKISILLSGGHLLLSTECLLCDST